MVKGHPIKLVLKVSSLRVKEKMLVDFQERIGGAYCLIKWK